MRLAFLCGSLEPGRDGVGDYTRRLAAECMRQGHECRLVALHDRGECVLEETQECEGILIGCLRCPASLPWEERFARVREVLNSWDPDWVSLQFVPYGFHPKGLPWRLARDLKGVLGARPLQIMFHELWIGFGKGEPLKKRVMGWLQRGCIAWMVRALKPRVVNTSNATYARLLKSVGVAAVELPLFGNIPVHAIGPEPDLPEEIAAAGLPIDPAERSAWWMVLFFGTLHHEWSPQPLTGMLLQAAQRAGKRLCMISVGRLGGFGQELWGNMERDHGREIRFVKCGEQSCERISALLQFADFGVAVTPWELMGKSGSAAAMLDHGLPMLVSRDGGGEVFGDPLFHRCDATLEAKLLAGLQRREPSPRAGEICARFLAALPIGSQPAPTVL